MKKILLFICLNIYFINYCAAFDPYPWTEFPLDDEVFIGDEIYLKAEPSNYQQAEKSILESYVVCEKSLDNLIAASKLSAQEEAKLVALKDLIAKIIQKNECEQKELYDFLYDNFADAKMIRFLSPLQRQLETVCRALRFDSDNKLNVHEKISQTLFFFMNGIQRYGTKGYTSEHCLKENCDCCYQVLSCFRRIKAALKKFI